MRRYIKPSHNKYKCINTCLYSNSNIDVKIEGRATRRVHNSYRIAGRVDRASIIR